MYSKPANNHGPFCGHHLGSHRGISFCSDPGINFDNLWGQRLGRLRHLCRGADARASPLPRARCPCVTFAAGQVPVRPLCRGADARASSPWPRGRCPCVNFAAGQMPVRLLCRGADARASPLPRGRCPRRRRESPPGPNWSSLTAIPRRMHRISSDLRS